MSIIQVHGRAACGAGADGLICFWWQRKVSWLRLAFLFMREFLLEDLAAGGFDLKRPPVGRGGDTLSVSLVKGIP